MNLIDTSTWMSKGISAASDRRTNPVVRCEQSKWGYHVQDFELWCRERNMLIEVSDADYCEPRLSVTD